MQARFRSDALWSAAGTLLPVALGAIAVPVLLRTLSADSFVAYALGLAVISFAPCLDFGVARTSFRRVAAASRSDPERARSVASLSIARSVTVGVLATLVLGLALVAIGATALVPRQDVERALWPLAVSLLGVVPAIIANTQRAILEGARLFSASAVIRMGLGVLTAVVPAGLSLITQNVSALCAVLVALRIYTVVYQHSLLRRHGLLQTDVRSASSRSTVQSQGIERDFWSESRWYAVSAPVSLLMSGFDRFVVMAVSGLTLGELAVFLAPQEIALKAIILPASLIPAVMVRMADDATPTEHTRRLALSLFYGVCSLVFVLCVAGSVLAPQLTALLFGSLDRATIVCVVQALAIGIFSNAVAQFPMAALSARGLIHQPALLQLVQLPIYLIALPWLLQTYGVAGAAWAWTWRIVLDTTLLSLFAHASVPSLRVRGWHLAHASGVAILLWATDLHRQ